MIDRVVVVLFHVALSMCLQATPVAAADMAKTLRVAFPIAETGFDPQAAYDIYSFDVCRRDLRSTLHLRLLRPPGATRPQYRGESAGDDRRRTHLHDPGEAGHLLRRRSRVQGQAARAHRRGLRLLDQANRSTRRCARTGCICSRTTSSVSTTCSHGRENPARSITTRRSKDCRHSTATRCKSASTDPTTRSSGGLRPRSLPRWPAKSSTRTRTRATGSWRTRSARDRIGSRSGRVVSGSASKPIRRSAKRTSRRPDRGASPVMRRSRRGSSASAFPSSATSTSASSRRRSRDC